LRNHLAADTWHALPERGNERTLRAHDARAGDDPTDEHNCATGGHFRDGSAARPEQENSVAPLTSAQMPTSASVLCAAT
jgi:hypothetical protein